MPIVLKSGNLSLLVPSGPVQACNGIALPFTLAIPPGHIVREIRRTANLVYEGTVRWLYSLTGRDYSLPVLISVSVVAGSGNEFRVQNKGGFISLILTVTFECLVIPRGKISCRHVPVCRKSVVISVSNRLSSNRMSCCQRSGRSCVAVIRFVLSEATGIIPSFATIGLAYTHFPNYTHFKSRIFRQPTKKIKMKLPYFWKAPIVLPCGNEWAIRRGGGRILLGVNTGSGFVMLGLIRFHCVGNFASVVWSWYSWSYV